MLETEIGKIPEGLSAQNSFIDFGTFLWAAIILGAAFFFFIGTLGGFKRAFQEGSRTAPSVVWFLNFSAFAYGLYLLSKSFKNQVVLFMVLGLITAGIISFSASIVKKEAGNKEAKK